MSNTTREVEYTFPDSSAEGIKASVLGQTARFPVGDITEDDDWDGLVAALKPLHKDARSALTVHNRAYILERQKELKALAAKDGATIETINTAALSFEPMEARPRGKGEKTATAKGTGKIIRKAQTAVYDDLLADTTLDPAMREMLEARKAALIAVGVEAPVAEVAAVEHVVTDPTEPNAAPSAPDAPAPARRAKK
jgi:hypothetical protein